jgi:hypothetical protein
MVSFNLCNEILIWPSYLYEHFKLVAILEMNGVTFCTSRTVLWIRRRLLLHTVYVIEAALHDRARSDEWGKNCNQWRIMHHSAFGKN